MLKLACLVDIFGYILNEFNLGLQGKNNDFFRYIDKVSTFMKTLQHWIIQVVQGRMFDDSTIQDIVTRHLDLLHENFMRYFPNEMRETKHFAWVQKNPSEVNCSKLSLFSEDE